MVLVTDADSSDGISGVQFGIEYQPKMREGVDILSWTPCAPVVSSSPGWPDSGSGIRLSWSSGSDCRRGLQERNHSGVATVVGYFYCSAYSSDYLTLVVHPTDGVALVERCTGVRDTLESDTISFDTPHLGDVTFSPDGAAGRWTPCGIEGGVPPRADSDGDPGLPEFGVDLTTLDLAKPVPITLTEGHGLFFNGRFYGPGHTVLMSYDPRSRRIFMDGEVLGSSVMPRRRFPIHDPDPSRGSKRPLRRDTVRVTTQRLNPVDRAASEIAHIKGTLEGHPGVILAFGMGGGMLYLGSSAQMVEEVQRIVERAETVGLSDADWARCRELQIEHAILELRNVKR